MPSTKKLLPALALGALALLTALPAAAQWQKPEQAIKYRQSAMTLQGNHMGRVFAMANGKVPFDAKVAAEQIEVVAMLNKLQFAAFVEGSDKGGNTNAKPEVWSEKDKFAAAVSKSQEDVMKLAAAGKTGNFDQIKAAAGDVGQSCKACHDHFKRE
jgi:cytochrome c556